MFEIRLEQYFAGVNFVVKNIYRWNYSYMLKYRNIVREYDGHFIEKMLGCIFEIMTTMIV